MSETNLDLRIKEYAFFSVDFISLEDLICGKKVSEIELKEFTEVSGKSGSQSGDQRPLISFSQFPQKGGQRKISNYFK